ncbi:MAG: ABC transporter permease [Elusimicrobia bacterium]|nr:ABC transporter permease [Elusimicrobiota bacterium]
MTRLKARLSLPPLLWLAVFYALPLGLIILVSSAARGTYGGILWSLSFKSYLRFFDPLYLGVLARSIAVAALSTVLCVLLGFPISWWMARLGKRGQQIMVLLILIPFWTNVLVRLYAWMFLLGSSGPFNSLALRSGLLRAPLEVLYTWKAVLLGFVYGQLPFMILPLYASLEKIDKSLIEAARDLYASSWQVFRRVILPLSKPGLVAGSVLVFASIPCDFVTPDLMGGSKYALMGNLIQQQYLVVRDWPFGSALSLIQMLVIGAGLLLYLRQEQSA